MRARPGTLCRPVFLCAASITSTGYSIGGACTNAAESYFSRLRRAELGPPSSHRRALFAPLRQEAAWREDLRRVSNGEQTHGVVGLAMGCPPSVDFCGYWQRAQA